LFAFEFKTKKSKEEPQAMLLDLCVEILTPDPDNTKQIAYWAVTFGTRTHAHHTHTNAYVVLASVA
jgi:hypothetical protein